MKRRLTSVFFLAAVTLASVSLSACGPKADGFISGTKITRNDENLGVINRVEEYRIAVEEKSVKTLMLMASQNYREDGGTPAGDDDYGFSGLHELLKVRFLQADSIRYSIRYLRVRYIDESETLARRAFVDVILDASFTIPKAGGGVIRRDKRDHGQFVLEWTDDKWMFLSGM